MSKYSIGLDLGINNVGWAIYDLDKNSIIDKGVVRYKESSDAQDRRSFRGNRRLNKRKHHRVERVAQFLNSINFNTLRTYEPELLELRIKGLNEQLTEQQITNVIYYFCIHRGYIPFDDEKPDRDVHEFSENEFPCMYIKEFFNSYGKYRGQCDLILMKDNLRELRRILQTQIKYNAKLDNNKIDELLKIISSKREFWEGPGGASENQLTPYGRYSTKEDLEKVLKNPSYHKYLYELLIGKCELSIDALGNIENVSPAGNFYAEEFNFYNDFINMSLKEPSLIEPAYKHKINYFTGKFTEETINEIKEIILNAKTISFSKIMKDVLGVDDDNIQGYRIDKNRKPEISKFEIYRYFVEQFKKANLKPIWLYSEDKKIYNKVVYVLTVAPSAIAIADILEDRISEYKFSNEEIEVLKYIKTKKNEKLKYHSLSESVLKKALLDMKKTHYELNFMQLMKKLEYEKEMIEYFQNNYSRQTTSPFYIEDEGIDDIIANPQVKKTLRKAIKVINAIIKKMDDYPETIVIESTKEMNGKKRRLEIESDQALLEKSHKLAAEMLEQNDLPVNLKNIEKVINWIETNYSCAYCGKPLTIEKVLIYDVEHILPKSKTLDSSSNNLTCSCERCNSEKSNRTPYEFLNNQNLYSSFKTRVLNEFSKMPKEKKENLLFEGNIEKYSIKFINRNLRDCSYATTELIRQLNKYNIYLEHKIGYKINLISSPGQLTGKIRRNLNLDKDRNYLYHHAIDAMILSSLPGTDLGNVLIQAQNNSQYWIKSKDEQHKHIVWNMIEKLHLINSDEIVQFQIDCDNQPEDNKEGLLKRSFEVIKNPIRSFANTNYSKFIIKNGQYYKISQINNIYDLKIREKNGKDGPDKALLDNLFDETVTKVELLCQEKDRKLFDKLKAIYNSYNDSMNPFLAECVYKHGLENGETKFNYLVHGIRKNENEKSAVVHSLRYLTVVSSPYLKNSIKNKKKNTLGEFTINNLKENTFVGLDSLEQVCARIYYSYTKGKFIYVPLYAISFKKSKLDENDNYYKETYKRLIGNDNIKFISDIYRGEWIGSINKKGEFNEGRYKGFDKSSNRLECNLNGLYHKRFVISSSIEHIIIYTMDILGNKYVRLDTRKIL